MTKLAGIAKLTFVPGGRDRFISAIDVMFEAVASEPLTEIYAMHLDAEDPDVIWFYEMYTDERGIAAHRQTEAMKGFLAELDTMLSKPFELTRVLPIRAKGISV